MVGAVGIEIASLLSKPNKESGVAPPPYSNWSLLEPSCLRFNKFRGPVRCRRSRFPRYSTRGQSPSRIFAPPILKGTEQAPGSCPRRTITCCPQLLAALIIVALRRWLTLFLRPC